jgi:hypothetical protein
VRAVGPARRRLSCYLGLKPSGAAGYATSTSTPAAGAITQVGKRRLDSSRPDPQGNLSGARLNWAELSTERVVGGRRYFGAATIVGPLLGSQR